MSKKMFLGGPAHRERIARVVVRGRVHQRPPATHNMTRRNVSRHTTRRVAVSARGLPSHQGRSFATLGKRGGRCQIPHCLQFVISW